MGGWVGKTTRQQLWIVHSLGGCRICDLFLWFPGIACGRCFARRESGSQWCIRLSSSPSGWPWDQWGAAAGPGRNAAREEALHGAPINQWEILQTSWTSWVSSGRNDAFGVALTPESARPGPGSSLMNTARNSKQETFSTILQNRYIWGDQYNRYDTVMYIRWFKAMYKSVAQTFLKTSSNEVANVLIWSLWYCKSFVLFMS